MHNIEYQYLDLVDYLISHGEKKEDRTGVGVQSTFGGQLIHDFSQFDFPLLTTKQVWFKGVVTELLWFLKGSTKLDYLRQHKNKIWEEWSVDGDVPYLYPHQWRGLKVDQIQTLINTIKTNPTSRRMLVDSWNVEQLEKMPLTPCHCLFQCYVRQNKYLDLQLYQRSADIMLGVPFNIASYSLLIMLLAQVTDLEPGRFIHTFGDVHIYLNHIEGAKIQLRRKPTKFPSVEIVNKTKDINKFELTDFKLHNYTHQGKIKLEIAV